MTRSKKLKPRKRISIGKVALTAIILAVVLSIGGITVLEHIAEHHKTKGYDYSACKWHERTNATTVTYHDCDANHINYTQTTEPTPEPTQGVTTLTFKGGTSGSTTITYTGPITDMTGGICENADCSSVKRDGISYIHFGTTTNKDCDDHVAEVLNKAWRVWRSQCPTQ